MYYCISFTHSILFFFLAIQSYTTEQCEQIYSRNNTVESTFYVEGMYSCGKVEGNYDGSYLTMISSGGLMFGIINIVGNFGTVFVDQSYWQSAIAARPQSAAKGYLLGGYVILCLYRFVSCLALLLLYVSCIVVPSRLDSISLYPIPSFHPSVLFLTRRHRRRPTNNNNNNHIAHNE